LAKVRDGDKITIDTESGSINDETPGFLERKVAKCPERKEKGILRVYLQIAGEAREGARL
jgi:dihydroxyacid dehydratase/phosphogluconate dehydratase